MCYGLSSDVQGFGLLTLMGMIRTRINLQLLSQNPPEGVLGQHSLNRQLDYALGMRLDHTAKWDVLLVAHVTGRLHVPEVRLLIGFLTGQTNLLGVDHHDVVACIEMRRIHRLTLTADDARDFSCKPTQRLIRCVYEPPMVLDFCCFWCVRSHACFLQKALLKKSLK